ncbi:MAG TPA: hypothetical protein VHH36_09295 [Candidatus Thermoplasmatota archaeon]|nr:hypothetical protein [Candidatus Thermoplasmatota archaeon]
MPRASPLAMLATAALLVLSAMPTAVASHTIDRATYGHADACDAGVCSASLDYLHMWSIPGYHCYGGSAGSYTWCTIEFECTWHVSGLSVEGEGKCGDYRWPNNQLCGGLLTTLCGDSMRHVTHLGVGECTWIMGEVVARSGVVEARVSTLFWYVCVNAWGPYL